MRGVRTVGRALAGLTLVALVAAGCGSGGNEVTSSGGAGGGGARQSASGSPASPPGEASGGGSNGDRASSVKLVDLGNRIVRKATVNLQVGKGKLNDTIARATDVVTGHHGIYVSASTSVPDNGPSSGQVTFRVPVEAFEATLRELKGLGTYRGERSSSEDVTSQYVDLSAQLKAWRAQERVYLRLLDRAKSISEIISVQDQLEQVQSNINRLQGQVDFLRDQSSYSTIQLDLSEPGAAAGAEPRSRFARAWATAVDGLATMGAAALVALVWLLPVGAVALLLRPALRGVRKLRLLPAGTGPTPPPAP
ncbi:MAG TPA: DUF4349 domain-containing protein [Actinomycetes bacterium]|jgi:hypothetical protein|nr:DUF4349 domain-containing protein [Actinomycetes bacterium]